MPGGLLGVWQVRQTERLKGLQRGLWFAGRYSQGCRLDLQYGCTFRYIFTCSHFDLPPCAQFIVERGDKLGPTRAFQLKTCSHSAKTLAPFARGGREWGETAMVLYFRVCQKQLFFVNYKLYNYCRPSRCPLRPWPKILCTTEKWEFCIFHTPHERQKNANFRGYNPKWSVRMVKGGGNEGDWGKVLKMARNTKMWPHVKCKQHEAVCQLAAIQKQQEVLCRSISASLVAAFTCMEKGFCCFYSLLLATCFNLFYSVKQQPKTTTEWGISMGLDSQAEWVSLGSWSQF